MVTIGEAVKTYESRQRFLRRPVLLAWRPYVQAFHDVCQWNEPLPQPSIEMVLRSRISASAVVLEEVPIPPWIIRIWDEEKRLGLVPDGQVDLMKIQGVLRRLREWLQSRAIGAPTAQQTMAESPEVQRVDVREVQEAFHKVCPEELQGDPMFYGELDNMIPSILDAANTLSRILRTGVFTPDWVATRLSAQLVHARAERERQRVSERAAAIAERERVTEGS